MPPYLQNHIPKFQAVPASQAELGLGCTGKSDSSYCRNLGGFNPEIHRASLFVAETETRPQMCVTEPCHLPAEGKAASCEHPMEPWASLLIAGELDRVTFKVPFQLKRFHSPTIL